MLNKDYKKLTDEELEKILPDSNFHTKLFRHQKVSIAFTLGEKHNRIMFIQGIGTGKSCLALHLLQCWNPQGKTLIVCPNSVIKTWKEEIAKHTNFKFTVLNGSKQERIDKIINGDNRLYLINYEGLKVIGAEKSGKKYVINKNKLKEYGFEAVIIDEVHHCKSWSLQMKITAQLTKRSRYVIAMTGTPISKSAIDLYGEFFVLDNGATFGTEFYWGFLRKYFYKPPFRYEYEPKKICHICGELYAYKKDHLLKHSISPAEYRSKYGKDETSESIILKLASKKSITYSREECIDLPERMYEVREVDPSDEQLDMVVSLFSDVSNDDLTLEGIKLCTHKLLQISSGFLLVKNGAIKRLKSNPKLAELKEIISQVSGKAIIYHSYIYESKMISELLKFMGEKYAILNGQITDKETPINKFLNNDDIRFLVAHPKTGGEGLNLQICNIIIYFNSGMMGVTLRDQSEGRIYRSGQKNACLYFDIILSGTVDKVLFNSLKNRTDYVQDLMTYFKGKKNECSQSS